MKPSETTVGMRVALTRVNPLATTSHTGTVLKLAYGGCMVRFDDGHRAFYQDVNDPWAVFTDITEVAR